MTIWHRNRRGRGCTTPRCRSRNIANNMFSEGWLQKSNEFAGLRTAPATHHAKNTANTTFSCGMLQNAGFGTIPCGGGGGGGSEPRTGIIYTLFRSWNVILQVCGQAAPLAASLFDPDLGWRVQSCVATISQHLPKLERRRTTSTQMVT